MAGLSRRTKPGQWPSKSVNVHYAKTHLSQLLEGAERGEEIVIARAGKPVVKLVAIEAQLRMFGQDRGKIWIADHFVAGLPRHRKDPFDRMLAAQAQVKRLRLATRDRSCTSYGIDLLPP